MDYDKFIEKQNSIYAKNRDTSLVQREGIKKGFSEQGGYLIVLRHPLEVTEPIEKFTSRLAVEVPCIPYGSHNLHTTISDYGLKPLNEFVPDEGILKSLSDTVFKGIENTTLRAFIDQGVHINYGCDWLFNQSSIFLAGQPTYHFILLTNGILEEAQKNSLLLREPWAGHITAARFTESRSSEQLQDLFKLMREAPEIPNSVIIDVDVGFFKLHDKSFDITIYDKFSC